MIPLVLPAIAESAHPFVTRLRCEGNGDTGSVESYLVEEGPGTGAFAGEHGLIVVEGVSARDLDGDIVLVHPGGDRPGRIERILRAGSNHNTLLITERCDQLCIMCSQPPKKTHVDRFSAFEEACLLAEPNALIGVSGGEPTLYKNQLCSMLERVLSARPDVEFHVLSNAQHFDAADVERLRSPLYRRVSWGIPIYAAEPVLHDAIVGKCGAFDRLEESFAHLIMAGARVELRTVLLSENMAKLPELARYISSRLRFIEVWSIMQLENIGFARNRWSNLYVNHSVNFEPIATALEQAVLHGVSAQLFNFPRCSVPEPIRMYTVASISDWKRKYMPACSGCREREQCCGFFEWHPEDDGGVTPL